MENKMILKAFYIFVDFECQKRTAADITFKCEKSTEKNFCFAFHTINTDVKFVVFEISLNYLQAIELKKHIHSIFIKNRKKGKHIQVKVVFFSAYQENSCLNFLLLIV